MASGKRIGDSLDRVTGSLPAGEERPGQRAMAEAVGKAIAAERHLIVQAGTGTGKSLAYLVPALLSERTTVVATATKALQDQLAAKDLPFLASHLDAPFDFAVLKGRSNYVCVQRLHEATSRDQQLDLDVGSLDGDRDEGEGAPVPAELEALAIWAASSPTGDRADLEDEPSARTWAAVSVGPRECPGASKCPRGDVCFAERARQRAASADVIVVNTHLYGLHLASGGGILPDHDVVVIDEAHQLEDTVSATAGVDLTPGRVAALARSTQSLIADEQLVADLDASADHIGDALAEHLGRRLRGQLDTDIADALVLGRQRIEKVLAALRQIDDTKGADTAARKERVLKAASSLIEDVDATLELGRGQVAWIEGFADAPVLKVAPIDVAPLLESTLWSRTTAVLTSATIPVGLAERIGLEPDTFDELDVGSPFDYEHHALLYCAAHLPDPRQPTFDEELHRELEALIVAAGGRTLALFTSYRAMNEAAAVLRPRVPWTVYTQTDHPKAALIRRFTEDESSCLFATISFWQGVDVPGPALSLLTMDRLPFPRPDEPLLQARREQARGDAFRTVDLPRATTLLAQGAGRLIRTATDRGVVAVFDPRLATNARYRWDVVNALPPMPRTKDRAVAETFLRAIRDARDEAADRSSS